ncbi:MAG TPA: sigma-54 dependent transcriptional regulator, partial [Candidatus Krumholzibacteria bacterium]|nr:sigma-54 dependent transcriptional regulator [Candidatus Krumholzibacteria bacterium]
MARILVVDDEKKMVTLLVGALQHRGHQAVGVHAGQDALDLVGREDFDVVLTDLRMEPVDGMAVLQGVRARSADTQVIVLTAYGAVETAVAALQAGAFQYLTKPFNFNEVVHVVEQAAETRALAAQNRGFRKAAGAGQPRGLLGGSEAARSLRTLIARVAPSDATVLVRGESGSGKEVVARAIHAASGRADAPFVAVNCAAIAETLLESELFGYRKGAFTGADSDREGLFEAARGGTLFLDEIGEAGAGVQAKLLRVLEEKRINRVGDPIERDVDVRIIAATNRPLEDAIAARAFREDLYFRLLVFPVD